eukprot:m.20758 g.20758  ORF g.20758 m.20758 type:complete len:214 (+) comp6941_c0_seq2:119-760(+)
MAEAQALREKQLVAQSANQWMDTIERWTRESAMGLSCANRLCNLILKRRLVTTQNLGVLALVHNSKDRLYNCLSQDIDSEFATLTRIQSNLRTLVDRMQAVHQLLLSGVSSHPESDQLCPEVVTPTQTVEASAVFLEAYKREYDVRSVIVSNILDSTERELQIIYLATWLHSPYVVTHQGINTDKYVTCLSKAKVKPLNRRVLELASQNPLYV